MTAVQLLVAFTIGAAALALWSYVRWPGAAPRSLGGAIVRAVVALLLLQVGSALLGLGDASPGLAVAVVVLVVVPMLTYAFLASIWFLKACVDQLRGA